MQKQKQALILHHFCPPLLFSLLFSRAKPTSVKTILYSATLQGAIHTKEAYSAPVTSVKGIQHVLEGAQPLAEVHPFDVSMVGTQGLILPPVKYIMY